MTTTQIGRQAEKLVACYLSTKDYQILSHNWKTKSCEIDIVAKRSGIVFFIEVKYRNSLAHGDGFDYITPAKVKQMQYAATLWMNHNNWAGNCELIGASVTGPDHKIAFSRVAA